MRPTAKMVNFGIICGISAFGLSQRLGIPRGEAATMIDNCFKQFPGVKRFMEPIVEDAKTRGYVETLTGRRTIRDITSDLTRHAAWTRRRDSALKRGLHHVCPA
ncbi:MAG: DNA polymerase [Prosthecobacter sp.]|uniref:DNA polymerase n=1 Tax=Prosthecobacter sp. TaxID=1965333 RepID=UPI0039015BE3